MRNHATLGSVSIRPKAPRLCLTVFVRLLVCVSVCACLCASWCGLFVFTPAVAVRVSFIFNISAKNRNNRFQHACRHNYQLCLKIHFLCPNVSSSVPSFHPLYLHVSLPYTCMCGDLLSAFSTALPETIYVMLNVSKNINVVSTQHRRLSGSPKVSPSKHVELLQRIPIHVCLMVYSLFLLSIHSSPPSVFVPFEIYNCYPKLLKFRKVIYKDSDLH